MAEYEKKCVKSCHRMAVLSNGVERETMIYGTVLLQTDI